MPDTALDHGANLRGANLSHADLCGCNLRGTNLTNATCGWTTFGDLDLSTAIGLDRVRHLAPSTVGVDTLFKSGVGLSKKFLQGCGLPPSFVDYIDDHVHPVPFLHYRTFLSYSTRDGVFADKLYSSLFDDHAISTWQDKHQILPGDDILEEINRGINDKTDKMVLVCSKSSLTGKSSWWIEEEIQRALDREKDHQRRTGNSLTYLIPVVLDDFLFSDECTLRYKSTLTSRHAATFTDWDTGGDVYTKQLGRLVSALRTKPIKPGNF